MFSLHRVNGYWVTGSRYIDPPASGSMLTRQEGTWNRTAYLPCAAISNWIAVGKISVWRVLQRAQMAAYDRVMS